MSIANNLMDIQSRIDNAAAASGRSAADIQLVAVSKTVKREMIDAAYAAGVRHFGENRVQDMRRKFERPPGRDSVVHLIGNLQTNKVRDAVRYSQIIESVDRAEVAVAIQRRCELETRTIGVLIQVNVAGEEQKYGCSPAVLDELIEATAAMPNLELIGLMTIAPLFDDAEAARPVFSDLRKLRDRMQARYPDLNLKHLSMGMTNDYEVAIQEGATMIRLGRAIFEG